jgi:hypothetical protein
VLSHLDRVEIIAPEWARNDLIAWAAAVAAPKVRR